MTSRLRPLRSGLVPLCGLAASLGCGQHSDTVFYPLSVEFEVTRSEAVEGSENVNVNVELNAPSDLPVEVSYTVRDVSASSHDACGTRDYTPNAGTLRFEPGQTVSVLSLRHLDDDLHEWDERLRLELVSAEGALVGDRRSHEHVIVDDDRELLIDVQLDFGARADGVTDDTEVLQQALDRASLSSAAVVLFPPGEYRVTSLELPVGIAYYGYGARLLQAPGQASNAQMLRLTHAGDEDAPLTLLQGFTLDGNREAQGPFTEWQYQESELFYVQGEPESAGRVRLVVEDVDFVNTGGNGIQLDTNTDATLCQLGGHEVFTDVVKLAGGNSRLTLREMVGEGSVGTTGVAITGQNPGFDAAQTVEVELEGLRLGTGDLEIDVQDGSSVLGRNIMMDESPFYLRAVRSSVRFSDSTFVMGPGRLRYNRIVAPHDVQFVDSRFILTESVERTIIDPEADRVLMAAEVTWDDVDYAFDEEAEDAFVESLTDQTLRFDACSFELAADVEDSDTTYVAGSSGPQDPSNRLLVSGADVASGFDAVFAPDCAVCSMSP